MNLEGGFQGRTNKLVDGCYSFWGAGDFPILSAALEGKGNIAEGELDYLFDRGKCVRGIEYAGRFSTIGQRARNHSFQ
jgi:prenyltransferase beta subunit